MAESSPRQRLLTFLLLPAFVVAVLVLDGITFRNSFQLEKLREQSVLEATWLCDGLYRYRSKSALDGGVILTLITWPEVTLNE